MTKEAQQIKCIKILKSRHACLCNTISVINSYLLFRVLLLVFSEKEENKVFFLSQVGEKLFLMSGGGCWNPFSMEL